MLVPVLGVATSNHCSEPCANHLDTGCVRFQSGKPAINWFTVGASIS